MAMSAPQPSRQVECKVVGTTTAKHAAALDKLLQGMAGLPGAPVLQHWVILKGPQRDESQPEVRLMQQLASFSDGAEVLQSDRCKPVVKVWRLHIMLCIETGACWVAWVAWCCLVACK
jgi:hypothetical protein